MEGLIGYVKWRGDITFDERGWNDVDNLVISNLVYTDFTDAVSKEHQIEKITIKEAIQKLFALRPENLSDEFLCAIVESARYRDLYLVGVKEIFSHEKTQFAALTVELPNESCYIAFRGTDKSLIGWKEDFCASYEVTPAQQYARDYLETIASNYSGRVMVGGHSKGGNLAIYAAMTCSDRIRNAISEIYSNDGPGLCEEFIIWDNYEKIKDKVIKIVPEFSVIGALFDREPPTYIVKSSGSFILQHDILTWQVEQESLIEVAKLDPVAERINEVFDQWIENETQEHRRDFIEDLFQALSAGGAQFVDQIPQSGPKGLESILRTLVHSKHDSKKVFWGLWLVVKDKAKKIDWVKLLQDKKMIQAIALFLIGVLFVANPGTAIRFLGSIIYLGIVLYCVNQLWQEYKEYRKNKTYNQGKILIFGAAFLVSMVSLITGGIVVASVNLIMAALFIGRCFWLLFQMMKVRKSASRMGWLYAVEAFLTLSFGVVALALTDTMEVKYILCVGTYLIFAGIMLFLKTVEERLDEV